MIASRIASKGRWLGGAVVGAMLIALVGQAAAAEPTAAEIAVARKLIDLKGADGIYDPVFFGVILKTKYTLLQSDPGLATDLDAVTLQIRDELKPRLNQLKNDVAKLYASHFSAAELNEAYKFYSTPLGEKLIKAEPQILQQSMTYAQQWADKLAEEVMDKMRDEMRKKGHQL